VLLYNLPEKLFWKDSALAYVSCNHNYAGDFGVTPEQIVGKTDYDLYPPEMAEKYRADDRRIMDSGGAEEIEENYRTPAGKEFVVRTVKAALKDEQGNVTGILGIFSDITARKTAEEALRKAHDGLEEKVRQRTADLSQANDELAVFRRFAEASGEGFGMSDFDGRIAYANPALCRLFGEERSEEVIGKNVSAYYSERYAERRRTEMIPALLENGYWLAEQTILPRQGKPIETLQSTFLIRDESGNPFRIAVVITDVTRRIQAREALRTSEEKYRGVAEACPDAIVLSDLNGRVLFASRQTWGLLGLADSQELVGRRVFDYVIESDRKRLADNIPNLVAAGVSGSTEYTAIRHDGTTVPVEASSVAIRDAGGQAKAVMAVIRDITKRKQAQEALERERQSLWRMLQASDHERRVISYEIHDGLAQYLAAATMQFQSHDALREHSPEEAQKAYQTAVELVRQAHSESRRLISEVRPPVIDEIGLETAISHLVHEQRRRGGPKIKFDSDVQFGRLPSIMENALYRIAQEALTNACKHSKSKKVIVTMGQEGDDVRLEVRDWGVGFNPQSVERGHFGLEGIRQRVRLLGGRLAIESTPGSGTLVQVVVPLVEKPRDG
jgi:PAS domain S-box-containing protein